MANRKNSGAVKRLAMNGSLTAEGESRLETLPKTPCTKGCGRLNRGFTGPCFYCAPKES